MRDKDRRRVERLARTDAYHAANADDFPETSKGGLAAADIRAALAEVEALETSLVASVSTHQQATEGKDGTRKSLYAQLRAISDTAKTIGLDYPEVKGSFRFTGARISDQALLATARAFLNAAQPLKARFIEYDMPADFLDTLGASIAAFEQHMERQTAGVGARIAANAAHEEVLRRGEAAMERFDTAARNKYRNNPEKLAAWESARRLERPARRPR